MRSKQALKLQGQPHWTQEKNQNQAQTRIAGAAQRQSQESVDPATQSQLDREANYVEAAEQVGGKLATDPDAVTKEDAAHMHSREHRAFGETAKGGIASHAQRLASENEKKGTI